MQEKKKKTVKFKTQQTQEWINNGMEMTGSGLRGRKYSIQTTVEIYTYTMHFQSQNNSIIKEESQQETKPWRKYLIMSNYNMYIKSQWITTRVPVLEHLSVFRE